MTKRRGYQQQGGWIGLVVLLTVLTMVGLIAVLSWSRIASFTKTTVPATTTPIPLSYPLKGLSFSPKTYDSAGTTDFFRLAGELHGAVVWIGDWQQLDQPAGGARSILTETKHYGLLPIMIVTAYQDSGSILVPIRPLDKAQQDSYIQKAKNFAASNQPLYLGVGVEVNRLHEQSIHDYEAFVQLFKQTVDTVHSVSPNTVVFTTFQLERLRGLRGGLYGGVNDPSRNDWSLLTDFTDADALGFTSYPGLVFHAATDMPGNYYAELNNHTSKPLLFSELGWQADESIRGWPATAVDQDKFINVLIDQLPALKPRLITWSFLYDQSAAVPFDSMGLFSKSGDARPAWSNFSKNLH